MLSPRAAQITAEKLESNRLRNSVFLSPEAQRLRQLRNEGERLVSPTKMRVRSPDGKRSAYELSPYARRIQQLREAHAHDAATSAT